MIHWIGIALFAAAAASAVRWWITRYDSLGRARSFPWFTIGFFVVLGIAAVTPWFLRIHLEHRLSDAASEVVGARVDVHCQAFGGAFFDVGAELGYVAFGPDGVPERSTLIKRNQCRDLSAYLRSTKEAPSEAHIIAVHVLSHEAMHMSGLTDEGETECLAVQRDYEMTRLLGAPEASARYLAVSYWQSIYPRMSSEYRSEECGAGGALDKGTPEAPWAITGTSFQ
ncbi:MAG: hypothetical protein H0V97_04250 [Actinobacteria bacterium]|nr:hypothetical protein [Actinomycetota bacterium]